MATATTTPMMTAVSTPPETGVSGGDGGGRGGRSGGELEKEIQHKARLLQILSSANTKHECFKYNTRGRGGGGDFKGAC